MASRLVTSLSRGQTCRPIGKGCNSLILSAASSVSGHINGRVAPAPPGVAIEVRQSCPGTIQSGPNFGIQGIETGYLKIYLGAKIRKCSPPPKILFRLPCRPALS